MIPQDILGQLLWQFGFAICNQLPERSFFIDGYQYPFCARDTGTFIGFFVVTVYALLLRKHRKSGLPDRVVLVVAAAGFALFAFDGLSSYLGFRDTTNALRLVSGLMMGSGIGFLSATLVSYVLLGQRNAEKTFTWKDLVPIYIIISVIGIAVYNITTGIAFYYAIGVVIAAGCLSFFFVFISILIALLTNKSYSEPKQRRLLIASSIIIMALLFSILWALHRFGNAAFPL